MYKRTRGISFAISIPTLARLDSILAGYAQIDGVLNIREIIGEDTQELRGLEHLCALSIMHPLDIFRRICANALDLCCQGMIRDVYEKQRKVYVVLQDAAHPPKHGYVCDVPSDYHMEAAHPFTPNRSPS
jgi:hypothetical protein